MTANTPHDPAENGSADARIDAMARSAGSQLRRPAPTQGFARVQRARRTQQISRAVVGSTAVLALLAVGAFVGSRRNADDAPAVATIGNPEPQASAPPTPDPSPVPTTASSSPVVPGSTVPPSTAESVVAQLPSTTNPGLSPGEPVPVGAAPAIYATAGFDPVGEQQVIDAATGEVTGSAPLDWDRSKAAQESAGIETEPGQELARALYNFNEVTYDSGTLNTDFFTDVDLCAQNVVTRPADSRMPRRARFLKVSANRQRVVTASTNCPDEGTMSEDGIGTSESVVFSVEVFDVRDSQAPGRSLAVPAGHDPYAVHVSDDGKFAALAMSEGETYLGYEIYDLDSGALIDLGVACPASGPRYDRFDGPFIGESSVALSIDCFDGTEPTLLIRDLRSGGRELRAVVPPNVRDGLTFEVDIATFSTPETAWFTMCGGQPQRTCVAGRGNSPVVELAGVSEVSFIPLGYYPGG